MTVLSDDQLTHDAFLGERVIVSQPNKGFRAGIDSVLLAAAVDEKTHTVLELGAGGGAVACCAMVQIPALHMHLVERDQQALSLLKHNIAQNKFDHRATILDLDINATGRERKAAGLPDNHFDTVIANPPFYLTEAGTLADESAKAASNHMPAADLDNWVKAAAASLRASGTIIFILPAARLDDVLKCFSKRFGAIEILPILPRASDDAHRILIRAKKGSKQPVRICAPLILHEETVRDFLPAVDQIFRGERRLHW